MQYETQQILSKMKLVYIIILCFVVSPVVGLMFFDKDNPVVPLLFIVGGPIGGFIIYRQEKDKLDWQQLNYSLLGEDKSKIFKFLKRKLSYLPTCFFECIRERKSPGKESYSKGYFGPYWSQDIADAINNRNFYALAVALHREVVDTVDQICKIYENSNLAKGAVELRKIYESDIKKFYQEQTLLCMQLQASLKSDKIDQELEKKILQILENKSYIKMLRGKIKKIADLPCSKDNMQNY